MKRKETKQLFMILSQTSSSGTLPKQKNKHKSTSTSQQDAKITVFTVCVYKRVYVSYKANLVNWKII